MAKERRIASRASAGGMAFQFPVGALHKERDDALAARDVAQTELAALKTELAEFFAAGFSQLINTEYFAQRVLETANRMEPRWECELGDKWMAYVPEISEQLEVAFSSKSMALFKVGRTQYTLDMACDANFIQVNISTQTQRLVRRDLVPLRKAAVEEQRPPPVFLDSYPKVWQGTSELDRVELPVGGAIGARLLDYMQSSIAKESAAAMSGLQIHRIERVENHVLWENYQRYRHVVSKRLADTTPEPLTQRPAVMDVSAQALSPQFDRKGCSERVLSPCL